MAWSVALRFHKGHAYKAVECDVGVLAVDGDAECTVRVRQSQKNPAVTRNVGLLSVLRLEESKGGQAVLS